MGFPTRPPRRTPATTRPARRPPTGAASAAGRPWVHRPLHGRQRERDRPQLRPSDLDPRQLARPGRVRLVGNGRTMTASCFYQVGGTGKAGVAYVGLATGRAGSPAGVHGDRARQVGVEPAERHHQPQHGHGDRDGRDDSRPVTVSTNLGSYGAKYAMGITSERLDLSGRPQLRRHHRRQTTPISYTVQVVRLFDHHDQQLRAERRRRAPTGTGGASTTGTGGASATGTGGASATGTGGSSATGTGLERDGHGRFERDGHGRFVEHDGHRWKAGPDGRWWFKHDGRWRSGRRPDRHRRRQDDVIHQRLFVRHRRTVARAARLRGALAAGAGPAPPQNPLEGEERYGPARSSWRWRAARESDSQVGT